MSLIKHLAIIMDGNGRWAKLRGLNRNLGHREGLKTVEKVIGWAKDAQIKYLSLYVFSTENWKRPQDEVDGIFRLADKYLSRFERLAKDNIRVIVSGERDRLSTKLLAKIDDIQRDTAMCNGICVNLCLNYGGRQEIVSAVNKLVTSGIEITESTIALSMYHNIPEPDLIVRTGGQMRLSNFLMFQSAYSELYFTDTLWPDFTKEEFLGILETYSNRIRNFGGVSEDTNE
ncbi:MAG: polyprenyl diphosphate synthase [Corallococcus sp.]|nr:polyprenyl diphosphate synthase [Corallococcus sp.]